jgi:hypothetical protein
MVRRRRTFGLLAIRVRQDLTRLPRLLVDTALHDDLDALVEDYFRTRSDPLIRLGREVGRALAGADELLRGIAPARPERRRRGGTPEIPETPAVPPPAPAPEPWMSRRGSDLKPRLCYRLLLEECLEALGGAPAELPSRATSVLLGMQGLLGLDDSTRVELTAEVLEEAKRSLGARRRGYEPRRYFERLYRMARSSSGLSPESRELLSVIGLALGITQEDFQDMRARLEAERRPRGPEDPGESGTRVRVTSGSHQRPAGEGEGGEPSGR